MWKVSLLILSTILLSGCYKELDGKQVEELTRYCKETKATTWKLDLRSPSKDSVADVICVYIDSETDAVYTKRASTIKSENKDSHGN